MSDLCIATCLWQPNEHTLPNSRCFTDEWVDRLYRGFCRNISRPFRFVCLSDGDRHFTAGVEAERLGAQTPHYGCMVEPFRIDASLIVCGLDTIILGNIDHMADYCLSADKMALVRDPYKPEQAINPIVLAPAGSTNVWRNWRGENDMDWLRKQPHVFMDDMWPGQVISLKAADVRRKGTQSAKIVYFHGRPKPHELMHLDWVRENWQ